MKIPADAIIAREKLTRYLLIPQRKSDKSRWLAQAGFTLNNPGELEAAIRQLIATADAVYDGANRYGDFYRAEGTLFGVNGINLESITIWIIHSKVDTLFRFVTMKPKEQKR
jgi:hypothetical protein